MPYKWKDKQKEYHKAYHKIWYEKNKQKVIDSKNERRDEIKKWFLEYKTTLKCAKCGFSHPGALDFHHENREDKERNIVEMVTAGYAIESIQKEIEKCIPLCSNCHRIHHYEERGRQ